jgi:hypothetical protein
VDLSRVVTHQQGAVVVDVCGDPLDLGAIAIDAAHAAEIGMATPLL